MVSLFATIHVLGIKATERLRREETGATAVEYGLLVGLLAVVITGLMLVFGPRLTDVFTDILPAVD